MSCLSGLTAVSLAWNRQRDSFYLALCIYVGAFFAPAQCMKQVFSQMSALSNSQPFSACMSRDHAVGLFSLPVLSFRVFVHIVLSLFLSLSLILVCIVNETMA